MASGTAPIPGPVRPSRPRPTFTGRARLVVDLGLGAMAVGTAGLLLLAWVEYLRAPGTSLVDGYWIGREPWTSLGVWTILVGSVVALLAGALVALIDGSWIRRVLAIASFILPASWWAMALRFIPGPSAGALGRPHPAGWTPFDLAYSLPEVAAIMLVLPALVAAALAMFPRRLTPSSRMARIHGEIPGDGPGR